MNKSDIYNGNSWLVLFDDGFEITSQVILGNNKKEAVALFESQTGFAVSRCTKQAK